KPTTWNTWKTEAIDFSQDFLWFDDYIFAEEKEVLKENNALDKWIEVDLAKDPDILENITNEMKLPVFECKECGEECEWCRYREDAVGSHMNEAKDSIIDPVDDKEVTLQKFAHSTCKGSVLARIDEGGNIIINDWSMGSYTEKYLGHDDAEADVSIPPSSKDKLITCLLEETFKQDDSRNFSGGYDFHNWLDEKSIDHKFSSWP
ncbi:hypothetical protein KKF03_03390, partial [Patescibacteria group bacterium]|nr:hypothetical protein [Patescibacteria group bacterium]